MKKFCTKCGGRIDPATGKCLSCGRVQSTQEFKILSKQELKALSKEERKAYKKALKKDRWKQLPLKQKFKKIGIRALIIVLTLAILTGAGAAALVYFDVVDIPVITSIFDFLGIKSSEKNQQEEENSETNDDGTLESIDSSDAVIAKDIEELDKEIENALNDLDSVEVNADEYFKNNSQIIASVEAAASGSIHTEADAYNNFVARGFTDTIESCYTMSGEYYSPTAISSASTEQHPYYQTTYTDKNNNNWMIYEINGKIMANPVSYNAQTDTGVQVMISETEAVMSYDSVTNIFYETIPNKSELEVKTVELINAETLDDLTFRAIERL